VETINAYLFRAFDRFADRTMQVDRRQRWTYRDAARAVHGIALHLRERGVRPGDRVALLAENSPRWLQSYLAALACGAVVVPRGEEIAPSELAYLLEHSGSRIVLAGSARMAERVPGPLPILRMDAEEFPGPVDLPPAALEQYARVRAPEDLAVILYTSGTTGRPKGVMLEHRNIAHNIRHMPDLVGMEAGDTWVSILPSWHTFEQTVELCGHAVGCVTVYSDRRRFRDDLREHKPQFFAAVPRLWESVHDGVLQALAKKSRLLERLFALCRAATRATRRGNFLAAPLHALGERLFYRKIRGGLGGSLKLVVSGGGYLAPHLDQFFADVGITLLIGYGLTETAPVAALRDRHDNVLGTIGRAVPETAIRVGPKGTFQVQGPQVMRGYYNEEALTRAVLDDERWFDTGDLGRIVNGKDLVFTGRLKETIVLSGGENIEPEPIENRILLSPYIKQVMLVGQDRKHLAALVVPDRERGATEENIRRALAESTGPKGGFRAFEAVHKFALIEEPFSTENGLLTATLKMRRNVIAERYAGEIARLYD